MNRTERIQATIQFMEGSAFTNNIVPRPIATHLWPHFIALTDASDVHRPFGYSYAMYLSYDEKWCFFYSAEVLVDATTNLTDEDFQAWLLYIRAHVSAHTTLDTINEDEVDRLVFGVMPEARDLVAKVHNHLFAF